MVAFYHLLNVPCIGVDMIMVVTLFRLGLALKFTMLGIDNDPNNHNDDNKNYRQSDKSYHIGVLILMEVAFFGSINERI